MGPVDQATTWASEPWAVANSEPRVDRVDHRYQVAVDDGAGPRQLGSLPWG